MPLKRITSSLIAFAISVFASAQGHSSFIVGQLVEEDSGLPMIQAGVQLLSPKDSSMIEGVLTDLEGSFRVRADRGDYILKFSYLGFQTQYRDIHKTASTEAMDLGRIPLSPEEQMLKGAVVAAKVPPVTVSADTVVYNAAAFRVSDDAMLEELLGKIPGVEVSDNGSVTLHGKVVQEILVNGKRFFGGDVKTGLKNLSADMIENIKAYERKSDFSRLTGVDDGEEVPVIDLLIKKNMLGGWRGNARAAAGPADDMPLRYNGRINANRITGTEQTSVVAGVRNTTGKVPLNTTSRSQLGYGGFGSQDFREGGVSFTRKPRKSEISGHLQYTGYDKSVDTRNQSESLNATSSTFSAANNRPLNASNVLKADAVFEYRPDKFHTLYIKPVFNMTLTGAFSNPMASSFNGDPLALVDNPNDWVDFDFRGGHFPENDPLASIRVNSSNNRNSSYSDRFTGSLAAYYVTKSEKKRGRNFTLRVDASINGGTRDQYVDYFVFYYRKKDTDPKKREARKIFVDNSDRVYSVSPCISMNEPFGKGFYLQMTLQATYRNAVQGMNYYNLLDAAPDWTVAPSTSRAEQKRYLPAAYSDHYWAEFSSNGEYDCFSLRGNFNLRYSLKKFYVSAGVVLFPQWGRVRYHTAEIPDGSDRSFTFNAAPAVIFKYNKAKTNQISFTYRSWSGAPSLYNLLPVRGGTNPLSVHIGNPQLKPSFTHSMNFSYNYSNLRRQTSFVANVQGNIIRNAASTSSEYIEETGGKILTAKNIDGNWNVSGNCVFNKTFSDNHFSLSNHAAAEYQNNVSFLYNSSSTVRADEINVVRRFMVKESLDFCYRNDILELIANAGGEYTDETSLLRPSMSQWPFIVKAGLTATLTFPWKMRISSDFSTLWQRGFKFDALNRNFYYLNADISQTILKGKATIRLDAYDLLNRNVNLSRSFGASSRSITTFSGMGRYVLLSFVYRFRFK